MWIPIDCSSASRWLVSLITIVTLTPRSMQAVSKSMILGVRFHRRRFTLITMLRFAEDRSAWNGRSKFSESKMVSAVGSAKIPSLTTATE